MQNNYQYNLNHDAVKWLQEKKEYERGQNRTVTLIGLLMLAGAIICHLIQTA